MVAKFVVIFAGLKPGSVTIHLVALTDRNHEAGFPVDNSPHENTIAVVPGLGDPPAWTGLLDVVGARLGVELVSVVCFKPVV